MGSCARAFVVGNGDIRGFYPGKSTNPGCSRENRAVPLIGPTEDKVELPVVSQTTRILVIWMELEGYPTVTVSVGPVAGSGDSDIV